MGRYNSSVYRVRPLMQVVEKDHTGVSVANTRRRQLFFPDPSMPNSRAAACRAALAELEESYDALASTNRAWYVFEGFTNPDIFIEGDDYIIVCEGKWTEPHITTKTTNLAADNEYRNQMVRHIQGGLKLHT